jgi:ABC-type transporter Mla subunit MlaD
MTNDRNALKAGLFIVISIGLVIGIIIGIKGLGQFLEPVQRVNATFQLGDDVGGLSLGDEVRIGGAKVGSVRKVTFASDADGKQTIVVTFTMPKHFTVRKDAVVAVQSTVTGVSVLNFSSLGTGDLLADDDSLVGHPGALTALLNSGTDIGAVLHDVRTVTIPKLDSIVDNFHNQLNPVLQHYYDMTDMARDALQQVRDLFGDTKSDFRTTVANLKDATGTMKDKLPALMDKVSTAVTSTNDALQDLKQVAANGREVSATARQVIVNNRGKLDAMIASLKTTGDNLKFASAEIRSSPWRLLYKPGPGEMANLNLYDSARQFAEGAGQLNDAAESLRDALKNPDVDQAQVQKLVDQLDKQFDNFHQVEQQLWTQVKE